MAREVLVRTQLERALTTVTNNNRFGWEAEKLQAIGLSNDNDGIDRLIDVCTCIYLQEMHGVIDTHKIALMFRNGKKFHYMRVLKVVRLLQQVQRICNAEQVDGIAQMLASACLNNTTHEEVRRYLKSWYSRSRHKLEAPTFEVLSRRSNVGDEFPIDFANHMGQKSPPGRSEASPGRNKHGWLEAFGCFDLPKHKLVACHSQSLNAKKVESELCFLEAKRRMMLVVTAIYKGPTPCQKMFEQMIGAAVQHMNLYTAIGTLMVRMDNFEKEYSERPATLSVAVPQVEGVEMLFWSHMDNDAAFQMMRTCSAFRQSGVDHDRCMKLDCIPVDIDSLDGKIVAVNTEMNDIEQRIETWKTRARDDSGVEITDERREDRLKVMEGELKNRMQTIDRLGIPMRLPNSVKELNGTFTVRVHNTHKFAPTPYVRCVRRVFCDVSKDYVQKTECTKYTLVKPHIDVSKTTFDASLIRVSTGEVVTTTDSEDYPFPITLKKRGLSASKELSKNYVRIHVKSTHFAPGEAFQLHVALRYYTVGWPNHDQLLVWTSKPFVCAAKAPMPHLRSVQYCTLKDRKRHFRSQARQARMLAEEDEDDDAED